MPERPGGPPVDRDGKIIGDIPWKFFDGSPDDPAGASGSRPVTERATMNATFSRRLT